MDKSAAKRWRPVIEKLFENLTRQEAIDATLLLLEAPGQKVVMVTPAPEPAPPRRTPLRAVPVRRVEDETAPPDNEDKPLLNPLAFFTVEEAAAYVGIGRDRMYQILRSDPEKLPHKHVPGSRGREEYRISGRGLNAFRYERMKGKEPEASGAVHSEQTSVTRDRS